MQFLLEKIISWCQNDLRKNAILVIWKCNIFRLFSSSLRQNPDQAPKPFYFWSNCKFFYFFTSCWRDWVRKCWVLKRLDSEFWIVTFGRVMYNSVSLILIAFKCTFREFVTVHILFVSTDPGNVWSKFERFFHSHHMVVVLLCRFPWMYSLKIFLFVGTKPTNH